MTNIVQVHCYLITIYLHPNSFLSKSFCKLQLNINKNSFYTWLTVKNIVHSNLKTKYDFKRKFTYRFTKPDYNTWQFILKIVV